jgi:hypothetical protein
LPLLPTRQLFAKEGANVDSTVGRKLWAAVATAIAALAMLAAAVPSAHGAGYPRPRGGSPYRTSLVPVYERCESNGGRIADTVHGAPLGYKSCKDPELISGTLTYGTPDANNKQANSVGLFSMTSKAGNSSTPANEADVKVDMSLTDVRLQAGLGDYTGELELVLASRITDTASGPNANEPGTTEDFDWKATVPCAATASTSIGSTCELHTTVNTLVPGSIVEGRRTIWEEADHIHVFDGGPDGRAATEGDNLLYAVQGIFVP